MYIFINLNKKHQPLWNFIHRMKISGNLESRREKGNVYNDFLTTSTGTVYHYLICPILNLQ